MQLPTPNSHVANSKALASWGEAAVEVAGWELGFGSYNRIVAFGRWDPIRDLLAIQQRLDPFAPGPAAWVPAVDLQETAEQYILTAELPGLVREDIDIQLKDGRLTLSGVRRERGITCEQYHRVERGHGSFSRTFELPVPVDADRVTADLRDGVLTVTCPKVHEGSARRIDVM